MATPNPMNGTLGKALNPTPEPRFVGLNDSAVNIGNSVYYTPSTNIYSTQTSKGVSNVIGSNQYGTGHAEIPNAILGQTKNTAQIWPERGRAILSGQQPHFDPVAQQQNFNRPALKWNMDAPQHADEGGDNPHHEPSSVRASQRTLLNAELNDRRTSATRRAEILPQLRINGQAKASPDEGMNRIGTFEDRFSGGGSTAEDRKAALDKQLGFTNTTPENPTNNPNGMTWDQAKKNSGWQSNAGVAFANYLASPNPTFPSMVDPASQSAPDYHGSLMTTSPVVRQPAPAPTAQTAPQAPQQASIQPTSEDTPSWGGI